MAVTPASAGQMLAYLFNAAVSGAPVVRATRITPVNGPEAVKLTPLEVGALIVRAMGLEVYRIHVCEHANNLITSCRLC